MKAVSALLLSVLLVGSLDAQAAPKKRKPAEAGTPIKTAAQPPVELTAKAMVALNKKCAKESSTQPKEIFLNYKAYLISYNPNTRNANWSKHEIYRDALERSCTERGDNFRADNRLKTEFKIRPIVGNDYLKTGYDQGHLTPSADMAWGEDINKESFFLTNMAPQAPDLNRHAWASLEGRVRRWACGIGHLKVYTGPVISATTKRLPSCEVVPDEFFKVILDDTQGAYKAIGFIYSQKDKDRDVWRIRAMTVAAVEKRTGLKFFTEFPEDISEGTVDELGYELSNGFKKKLDIDAWEKSEKECRACDGKAARPEN